MPGTSPALLRVQGLSKRFGNKLVLDDVSFDVPAGSAVALVGESGSGKSTIARAVLRLVTADAGAIFVDGSDVLVDEPRGASLAYRARVQMVFQDPFASLNPVHSVRHHLERPLVRHAIASDTKLLRQRSCELLETVGLSPAEDYLSAFPTQLSGGQRQRVAIARALAVEPQLLVADEPTSMLDASIRMGVLGVLNRLVVERGVGLLLITHDLATARLLCDHIVVLYAGRVVEQGNTADVLGRPEHPYTRSLIDAVPKGVARVASLKNRAPEQATAVGCAFAAACPEAIERCRRERPPLLEVSPGRPVRCFVRPPNDG